MEIKNIKKCSGSIGKGIRIQADVITQLGEKETVWFESIQDYEKVFSLSGNSWLVGIVPVAMVRGEDLFINGYVDAVLLSHVKALISIWHSWFPRFKKIKIHAKINHNNIKPSKCMSFFTGGVDSTYTLLSENNIIDDLVNVWGFDIPLHNKKAFDLHANRLRNFSSRYKKNLILIATNLKEFYNREKVSWGKLGCGAALAMTAYLFEERYDTILSGAGVPYELLSPWGEHPLTFHLYSSRKNQFIFHGADVGRFEKARFISEDEFVLDNLYVCWRSESDKNCSKCGKCYRTMISLDILKKLNGSKAFDLEKYSRKKIPSIYLGNDHDIHFFEDMVCNCYDTELTLKMKRALVFSRCYTLYRKIMWRVNKIFGPFIDKSLEKALFRNMIR